ELNFEPRSHSVSIMAVAEFVMLVVIIWEYGRRLPKAEIGNLLVRQQCPLRCVAMVHMTI
ncbi:hypothetical protein H5410_050707, partial [Solanum commersonii]